MGRWLRKTSIAGNPMNRRATAAWAITRDPTADCNAARVAPAGRPLVCMRWRARSSPPITKASATINQMGQA